MSIKHYFTEYCNQELYLSFPVGFLNPDIRVYNKRFIM